ncbi:MAG: hypothetical protein AUG89_06025 [Acidobacteria bacterium 13_1_20CM_4_56_7]|nr:MAG: hypothetical protein AUG89_06025 [Acidobacteria bacterium 13_1_20CM_4_56_7]
MNKRASKDEGYRPVTSQTLQLGATDTSNRIALPNQNAKVIGVDWAMARVTRFAVVESSTANAST